ncbi:hypothetical protein Y032_0031g2426 [Ancylostoma ceylanicum]|nr:hypothetical protein Y032_0031g2426 [Ancylostoma ceylanicum]
MGRVVAESEMNWQPQFWISYPSLESFLANRLSHDISELTNRRPPSVEHPVASATYLTEEQTGSPVQSDKQVHFERKTLCSLSRKWSLEEDRERF